MFIHTRLSAPKMFAKFGCETQTFVTKKRKKNGQPSLGQIDYRQLAGVRDVIDSRQIDKSSFSLCQSNRNVRYQIEIINILYPNNAV